MFTLFCSVLFCIVLFCSVDLIPLIPCDKHTVLKSIKKHVSSNGFCRVNADLTEIESGSSSQAAFLSLLLSLFLSSDLKNKINYIGNA